MSAFNMSMFESIKGALASSNDTKQGLFREIMQTKPGNTYTVRLLPNVTSPADTFYEYSMVGWNSFATGQYKQFLSPATFDEPCPILTEKYRLQRMGTDAEKEKAQQIRRSVKTFVNVYVVKDPTNPENEGKVKILRYGKQLEKIINEALGGELADEFGAKIFDLSDAGASFQVKCEQQGDYPTYVSSRFTTAGKLGLSEEAQNEIYKGVHDLKAVNALKSNDELTAAFKEHFLCTADEPVATPAAAGDTPPWSAPAEAAPAAAPAPAVETPAQSVEDDIDDLLADL